MIVLSAEQMARMSRLLDEALPLSRDKRQGWLNALPPEHRDLATALRQALLPARERVRGAGALDTLPKLDADPLPEAISPIAPGEHVGPYQLVRPLGIGGMAEVWLAHRADGAFKRDVALKLPLLARLRTDLVQRFTRERDILAALEHPNIARLYDAGVSPDGLPYLAMEYVPGQPLTDWCDARRLGVPERLKLFLQVLDAVQYAHARHVLHRDIKPSNILVIESGQVRLLDFGVAKLLAEEEPDAQLTRMYGRALTPEYASPECLRGDPVDAGTDIYSLGVVLYELLAGSRPYQRTAGASTALVEQAILEARPRKPSTRVTEQAAAARATSAERLARRLRGDLDSIVRKALSKYPAERYPSAVALADDVQRYLHGKPVLARQGPLGYRATKFALRHRATLVAAVPAVALVAAAIGYALTRSGGAPAVVGQAVPAALAPAAERGAAASAAGGKSIAVLPFLDMSEKKDQEYFSDGLSEELIERLWRSQELRVIARTSSFQFKGRNEDVRTIARKLGVSHLLEGSVRKSGNTLRVTAQLIRASDGSQLWSRTYERDLNDIFKVQDDIAETVARELKVALNAGAARVQAPESNTEAYNLFLQGNFFDNRRSKPDEEKAIQLYREAIGRDASFALAWARLAGAYRAQARFGWTPAVPGAAKARDAVQRALQIDPNLARAHLLLGQLYRDFDWNWAAARAELERAIELDPNDLTIRVQLGYLKAVTEGRPDQHLEYLRQELLRDPLDTNSLWILGTGLLDAGRPEESVAAFRELLELNPEFAGGHASLSGSLLYLHRYPEALAAVQKEADEGERLANLPMIYWAMGRRAESDAALSRLQEEYGAVSAYEIAEVHAFRGEADAALQWLDRAYRQRDADLQWIKNDTWLRSLHGDPRYRALLGKMNLATEPRPD